MPGTEILVLGATDPLGICVLQELPHRNRAVVAYARTLSKIPTDVSSNTNLEASNRFGEMIHALTSSRSLKATCTMQKL
jgi:hypothetical protein